MIGRGRGRGRGRGGRGDRGDKRDRGGDRERQRRKEREWTKDRKGYVLGNNPGEERLIDFIKHEYGEEIIKDFGLMEMVKKQMGVKSSLGKAPRNPASRGGFSSRLEPFNTFQGKRHYTI